MKTNYYSNYFKSINQGLEDSIYHFEQKQIEPEIFFQKIKENLKKLRESRNRLYFFGNGASAAFASHMALDFSKNGKILSRTLSDSALLTALSNDYSYECAMVEFLKIERASKDDLVITISSSGNSPNVVNVLDFCKEMDIPSLALSGLKNNNKSIEKANFSIYVPKKTYGMVECIHQIFLHLILDDSMEVFEWDRDEFQNMNSKNLKF